MGASLGHAIGSAHRTFGTMVTASISQIPEQIEPGVQYRLFVPEKLGSFMAD
jgi:hypothetical protein